MGEKLKDLDGDFWPEGEWRIRVADEEDRTVCAIRVSGEEDRTVCAIRVSGE